MRKVSRPAVVLAAVVLAASLTTSGWAAPHPGDGGVDLQVIILPAGEQPAVDRPELDSIKRIAAEEGIPLEAAVEAYIDQVAETDPEAWANMPDGRVETPDVMIDGLHAAELEDLLILAEGEGLSYGDAIDVHGWHDDYARVVDDLAEAFPDEFTGAVKAIDGSEVWLGFKNFVPERAVDLARTLPVRVEIVGRLGYIEDDIVAAQDLVHEAVVSHPATAQVVSSHHLRTGVIEVEAEPVARITSSAARDTIAASIETVLPTGVSFPVTVTVVDDAGIEELASYIRGGGLLTNCTAGFTLKYISSSTKRLGTAGHCAMNDSTLTYKNHPAQGGSTSITRKGWHRGEWGDLAIYTTGSKTAARTFYRNWDSRRYVDRQRTAGVGDPICVFGKATGNRCGTVRATQISSTKPSDGVTVKRLTTVNGVSQDHGDSPLCQDQVRPRGS